MPVRTLVDVAEWGTVAGERVKLFILTNDESAVKLCSYGARITSLRSRDRAGAFADIVLGADDLGSYVADRKTYMGAVAGRFANRIAGGRFTLEGHEYQVPQNNEPNALHGGSHGFDQKVWAAEVVPNGVRFTYLSPDGEMGFPGELLVRLTYTLKGNALQLEYDATADRPTVVSLTNHAYFNLTGRSCSVASHELTLHAKAYTPVDAALIPTGEIRKVDDSPLDFRERRAIGVGWDSEDAQIQLAGGYDQNWVLDSAGDEPVLAAEVVEPQSGRKLTVYTTEPGIQFYTGNFLDGTFVGRNGPCERRSGFCLETQRYPDTPNHAAFPSARVDRDTPYRSITVFVVG